MKFKFFEHTADAKFQAYGKDLEEAFSNAAIAMYNVITDTNKIKAKIKKEIKVEGGDLKSLLYNWLEEFLFLIDTEDFLLSKVEKLKINKMDDTYELMAVAYGDKVGSYEVKGDIKAVTYQEMEIKKKPAMVQVVVDI